MKYWWQWLITFCLGLIFSWGLNLIAAAQTSPMQLVDQARQAYQEGEFTQSIELLQEAHHIYERQEKYLSQIQVLSLTSLAQQEIGRWQLASQSITNALTLMDKIAPTYQEIKSDPLKLQVLAQISNTQGHLEFIQGKSNLALRHWQQAEQLYRQLDDQIGIAGSLLGQAQALEKMGFYHRSCNLMLSAFNHSDYDCDHLMPSQITTIINQVKQERKLWQVEGLNKISNSLLLKRKLSQAKTLVQANQKISSSLKSLSPATKAKIILGLGNINKAIALQAQKINHDESSFMHHAQKAIGYYQQLENEQIAPQIVSQYKLPAKLNLLSLLITTKQWSKAKNLVNQIQLPAVVSSNRPNLYAEIKFAQDLERLKQHQTIKQYSWQNIADIYLQVIKQAEQMGDLRAQSYALGYLGMLSTQHQELGLNSTSLQLLESALNLAQQIQAPEIAYRWQWQLGKIYAAQNQQELAIANYQAALTTLNSLRHDLVSLTREIQFDFQEQILPIYQEFVALLVHQDAVSNADLAMAVDTIESLQIAELDNYFQDACVTSEVKNISQIDHNAVAIYTMILPNSLEVILEMPDSQGDHAKPIFRHHTASVSQAELAAIVNQLRLYITEPDRTIEIQKLAQQLHGLLIQPLAADLITSNPKNLVFILDGILQTIPMSVLYDGEQYLLEKYAIAITPGLRVLNLQEKSEKSSFLAGGITQSLQIEQQKFWALDNVATELDLFSSQKSKILRNQEFTPENLLAQINTTSADRIHLATHGQFNSNPDKTFLLLWQQLLTIKDFSDLLHKRRKRITSPIDLLVLSACNTASGDRYAALGLAGVAIRSGALTTIATLWQVNDESTAILMKNFYQYQRDGHDKAEALRLAQLDLWQISEKDWQVPAFWSAYINIGNWR